MKTRRIKIFISVFLAVLGLASIYFIFVFIFNPTGSNDKDCPFCNPGIIENQKYYEDDLVWGLYSHRPLIKGHCLIVPKRHIERFDMLNQAELLSVFSAINNTNNIAKKILQADSYLIIQKNGQSVGQAVPHAHFHYIPRSVDEKNVFSFMLRFLINPLKSPISKKEMQDMTSQFSSEI